MFALCDAALSDDACYSHVTAVECRAEDRPIAASPSQQATQEKRGFSCGPGTRTDRIGPAFLHRACFHVVSTTSIEAPHHLSPPPISPPHLLDPYETCRTVCRIVHSDSIQACVQGKLRTAVRKPVAMNVQYVLTAAVDPSAIHMLAQSNPLLCRSRLTAKHDEWRSTHGFCTQRTRPAGI